MGVILPLRLKVPGSDQFRVLAAVSTSFRFHGFLRLDGSRLTIQWGGVAQVQEVGAMSVRDEQLALPDESLTVDASELYRASLAGGWWRPRLRLQARALGVLAMVPSEEHGVVQCWYDRSDGANARDLTLLLSQAIAAASHSSITPPDLGLLEEPVHTPPGGTGG